MMMMISKLVESPRIRRIKSLNVGLDVTLTENNCTHHYNSNTDLKTTLLV